MNSTELKERLMKTIAKVENTRLLSALYDRLLSAPQQLDDLNNVEISAIEEAREHYGTGKTFTIEEGDLEMEKEYITGLVASGEYQNNREVIMDALRLHKMYREKEIEKLREEIDLGWDGPDSSMSMEEIIESLRKS